ncbi:response regulator transcription factor [Gordonia sp. ABSL11-1]|jgi:two-component system, NarL family, response regulator DevR|uniref:MadR family response regulator transcription factor n=1 Tax=Gordonia sp. ABSL11-1 TaxID=3053924 RepID=UPI00257255EF|nr:response regulator transcription factor [Gordonia sp. ABSL11-1]MDL9946073.1 response regulator transcription factor [Gordonia sp. ABSL11-1]
MTAPETTAVRTMLVDDHALLREGIRSLLDRETSISVVGEADSYDAALAEVARCTPDVVVVDLKLTAGTEYEGLRLIREITSRHVGVAALVLTTFLDDDLVVRAVKAGARGYVVKDVDTTELVRAIQAVSGGGSAFDPRSAAIVLRTVSGEGDAPEALTEREREVLRLLADGLSNKRIGQTLYISESTVKFHIRNIIRKLGVSKRTDAVYIASKRGLI